MVITQIVSDGFLGIYYFFKEEKEGDYHIHSVIHGSFFGDTYKTFKSDSDIIGEFAHTKGFLHDVERTTDGKSVYITIFNSERLISGFYYSKEAIITFDALYDIKLEIETAWVNPTRFYRFENQFFLIGTQKDIQIEEITQVWPNKNNSHNIKTHFEG